MKLQKGLVTAFEGAIGVTAILAAAVLIFLMLSVSTDVVMRYFFNRPMIWVLEISEILLLFLTFLGAAWVLREGGHVKMDLVFRWLKPRTEALLNLITYFVSAIALLVVTWYSAEATWDLYQRGAYRVSELEIPYAYYMVIIPVGGFLLGIQALRMAYGYLDSWRALRHREQKL